MKYGLILILMFCSGFSNTSEQQWDAFAGTWQLIGDAGAADKQVKTAIDQATEKMSFLTRGIARQKLASVLTAQKRIIMRRQNQMFMIHPDTYIPMNMPISGEAVKLDDRLFRVSLGNEGSCLALRHSAEDSRGKRQNIYRLHRRGASMEMEVTVTSSQIPAPVRFKLQFSRVN